MKFNESFDKYYATVEMKVSTDKKKATIATFKTESDVYTVTFSGDSKYYINIGHESVPIQGVSISFSSQNLSMGHADASHVSQTLYVYPTIMKIISLFAKTRLKMGKPVHAFTCSVAGDNSRGSKKKIYNILFRRAQDFGYQQWKGQLFAIQKDVYDKLKKNGFITSAGNIIFDPEL